MPFSNDPQIAVYDPFIDYETGEIKQGSQYFKPLSRTIRQYVDHLEHKFGGEIGVLERKHVHADGAVYIGKKANNIDEQELNVKQAQVFLNKQEIMQILLALPQKQAEEWGVDRKTFQRIKRRIIEKGNITLNTVAVKKLVNK